MARAVEIDEEELLRLRQTTQVIQTVFKNPKAAARAEEAVKMVFPDARTPNLDALRTRDESESRTALELTALKKEIADDKAKREQDEKLARLNEGVETGIARLRKAGWVDDGIEKVRKIMEDKGILDVEVAAAYYEKQHPPQDLVTPRGTGAWNFAEIPAESDDYTKKLLETKGQNDLVAERYAQQVLNEVRGR